MKRFLKRIFLENLGTKATALFLAFLTWAYLFAQGQASEEIEVEFIPPSLDMTKFASVTYKVEGSLLKPGGLLKKVRLSGPKGAISQLSLLAAGTYKCRLSVDPTKMDALEGKYPVTLLRNHFDVPDPDAITVTPPVDSITIDYVRYDETTIKLKATKFYRVGNPAPGYMVDSITTLPSEIRANVPANRFAEDLEFDIKYVPVAGKLDDFTLENWELRATSGVENIQPLERFRVEVRIVSQPYTEKIPNLRLFLNVKPESQDRIVLETKTITIGIQGPEELVREAKDRPAAFLPFIIVTDADLATPGNKNLPVDQIGCHVQDTRFKSLTIIPMADIERPENRQVKIKVLPKPPGQD